MGFFDKLFGGKAASETKFSGQKMTVMLPIDGKVIPLEQLPDETFASAILGPGCGVEPTGDTVYAPFDGTVTQVPESLHAVGMMSDDGIELLIHVGMDTVEMKGQGFTSLTKEGAKVKAGTPLLKVDLEAIRAAGGVGVPTIKPWNQELVFEKLDLARTSGCKSVAMDIDGAGLPFLKNMTPPAGSKSVQELSEIIRYAGMPFIVKGVMTVRGAQKAAEAGAAAIIVSNHGGRVLGQTPASAEVLPEIADAVGGSMKILVDGGIRTGTDVFKALALGADAVLIGWPETDSPEVADRDDAQLKIVREHMELMEGYIGKYSQMEHDGDLDGMTDTLIRITERVAEVRRLYQPDFPLPTFAEIRRVVQDEWDEDMGKIDPREDNPTAGEIEEETESADDAAGEGDQA